jgi:putative redox protein
MTKEPHEGTVEHRSVVRRPQIRAYNGGTARTVISVEGHQIITDEPVERGGTDEGLSPLQALVASLCGCEAVTFHRAARKFDFDYAEIEVVADYTLQIGRAGDGPRFKRVGFEATVRTDESADRLQQVADETERQCPIYALFAQTDVRLETRWVCVPLDEARTAGTGEPGLGPGANSP